MFLRTPRLSRKLLTTVTTATPTTTTRITTTPSSLSPFSTHYSKQLQNNNDKNDDNKNDDNMTMSYFDDHLRSIIEKNKKKMQESLQQQALHDDSEDVHESEMNLRRKLGLPENYPKKISQQATQATQATTQVSSPNKTVTKITNRQDGETIDIVYDDVVEEQRDSIMSHLIDSIIQDVSIDVDDVDENVDDKSGYILSEEQEREMKLRAHLIANKATTTGKVTGDKSGDKSGNDSNKLVMVGGMSREELLEKEALAARLSFDQQSQQNLKLHDQLEKFYKSLSIHPHMNMTPDGERGFVVRIGAQQMLRSPSGRVIVFPNRHLAAAVVGEWELQRGYLRPATMPLTDLVGQWQDLKAEISEGIVTGFGRMVKRTIVGFFDSEVTCLRQNFSRSKAASKRMNELWDPLVQWFEHEYHTQLNIAGNDIDFSDDCAQNEARMAFIERYSNEEGLQQFRELFVDWSSGVDLAFLLLDKLNAHQLITLYAGTQITKSIVISAAIMHNQIDAKQALEASQLLLREQVKQFGLVEGEHDVLFAEEACKLGALTLFRNLCEYRQE